MIAKNNLLAQIATWPCQLRKKIGFFLIVGSMLATVIIWFLTVPSYAFITADPFLFLSKIVVLLGTIGMCWTFILATREGILEMLFDGLDKMYHMHKNVARLSFVLICLHPVFQFMRFVPQWSSAFGLFIPGNDRAIDFGLLALLLFILLIALTLWIRIPYHIWKRTHEFFIVVLLLTFLHVFFIDKHVNASLFLSIWVYGFMALAAISYIYIRFFYWYAGPRYQYVVKAIESIRRKTWNIYLTAQGKPITYQPGQFIYISFNNEKLGTEVHPFSLSSHPHQPLLRVSIKNLGDYTANMDYLKVGDQARLWGPYGCFYEKYIYEHDKDAVLIAGGIGITPFLSMIGFEAQRPSTRKTYLFYCVKDEQRADFDKELTAYAQMNPSIIYIRHCSDESGFLTVAKIKDSFGLQKKNFFVCGPKPMMDAFIKQLTHEGVKNSNIICEDFNFL